MDNRRHKTKVELELQQDEVASTSSESSPSLMFSRLQLASIEGQHGSDSKVGDAPTLQLFDQDHMQSDNISTLSDDEDVGLMKRRIYDQYTIEGSPRAMTKRQDTQATPLWNRLNPIRFPSNLELDTIAEKFESENKVLIISAGGQHETGSHQENARRTELLSGKEAGCLRRSALIGSLEWIDEEQMMRSVTLTDLLRVHDYVYLKHLENKVHEHIKLPSFYASKGMLDNDTPLGSSSLDAAKRYCGAALLAVDKAMSKNSKSRRIMVLGRPPGHHAGSNGCVVSDSYTKAPHMASSGFCLLNTVAVAAAYCRNIYGNLCNNSNNLSKLKRPPRIAIVDIDIHHGNGTEEIVRNLKEHSTFLPLPSSWAPRQIDIFKPWFDEYDHENVLFSSISLVASEQERFYPCSGGDFINTTEDGHDANVINISLTPIGPGPWDYKTRINLKPEKRLELCNIASQEFRTKVSTNLLPRLKAFHPDVIFISSGFDGIVDDFYHFLVEDDYHWITKELCLISDLQEPSGSVISILEGGYSLETPYPVNVNTKSTLKGTRKATQQHSNNSGSGSSSEILVEEKSRFAQIPSDGGLVKG